VHRAAPSTTETRLYLEALERSLVEPHKYVNGASRSGGELDLWIGVDGAAPEAEGAPPGVRRAPNGSTQFQRLRQNP